MCLQGTVVCRDKTEDWCWSSNTLATWCKELTPWKRPWCGKGMTEDEMVGCHHHSMEAPGVGDGQGGLACCGPWGCKMSDMTDWSELNWERRLEAALFCEVKPFAVWGQCCLYEITSVQSLHMKGCFQRTPNAQFLKDWFSAGKWPSWLIFVLSSSAFFFFFGSLEAPTKN